MSEPGVGKVYHSKMVSKVPKVSSKRGLMEQEPKFLVLVLMTDCFLFLSFFSPPLPPSPLSSSLPPSPLPSFPLPFPICLPTFLPSFLPTFLPSFQFLEHIIFPFLSFSFQGLVLFALDYFKELL